MDKESSNYETTFGRNGQAASGAAARFDRAAWPFPGWSVRFWLGAAAWVAVLAIVSPLADDRAAAWVGRTIPVPKLMTLFDVMKAPGHFVFTLLIAAALALWHRGRWRAAAFLCLSGIVSGALCGLLKWGVGRTRPLHKIPAFDLQPFRGGLVGLLHGDNLSFPSGHTCLAFASAAALAVLLPRWRVVFFGVALIVAAERILQGSHYAGDVVAAAGLGVLSTYIVWFACDRLFPSRSAGALSTEG
jgi:membrane-associated phospholipid phosphatase